MIKKTKQIPDLQNNIAAAKFFDNHDTMDFIADTSDAALDFPKPSHKVVVELDEKEWQQLRKISRKKKLSFNRFLRNLIKENL